MYTGCPKKVPVEITLLLLNCVIIPLPLGI